MLKLHVIRLFLCFIVCSSFNVSMRVDEIIRRKLENLPVFHALNREYEIFCIPSVRDVYLKNDFEPVWIHESAINDFITVILKCDEEGLNPNDYHLADIEELRGEVNTPDGVANLDIVLTDAFLLYTSHILSGKTNPVTIDAEWHVLKTDNNPVKYVTEINDKGIEKIVEEIAPGNKNYILLQAELKKYRSIAKKGGWDKIERGEILRQGMSSKRIVEIRKRLLITGELVPENLNSEYYDDTLKLAVINFQKSQGLEAIGTIGNETIDALSLPVEERIKSIEVNLERLRWLPQEVPNYYIMVNIVNFELDVIRDNTIARSHKVIVGKPYRKTPVFSSTMQYIVFNPTWTVPPTILTNDLIPEIRKNKNYLTQKNINVYDAAGKKLNPDSIDWKSKKVISYTYRQEPGKQNALGVVKFMFPNNFNVYLHDTPSKELFEKTERAFSSGCIRVQKPLELAEYLLRDQSRWNKQFIQNVVESAITQTVMLNSKPEVYLLYLTAWVDDFGKLNFRKDIYERDENLYKALTADPVYDLN